ncbi:dihydropteroate synthase [Lewinellaceae bacterium SD302]|nr:dihydropteroate synthase [Lewinellaceae bacterium SD302]
MLDPQLTLNCNGRLLSLDRPRIMGIININDNSFYAGSRYDSVDAVLKTAQEMLDAGADILDLGAMSTRPGAETISAASEQQRLLPVLKALKNTYPEAIISVDTVYADTARKAAAAGAGMINDVSAGSMDPELFPALAELGLPYVLMHMRGRPKDMQKDVRYDNLLTDVYDFLAERHAQLTTSGVNDVIIDPGFGFGKSLEDNYRLLANLGVFRAFNRPVLCGISRKSMIWRALGTDPAWALNGTSVLHLKALQEGAAILRAHDVKEARQVVRLHSLLEENRS